MTLRFLLLPIALPVLALAQPVSAQVADLVRPDPNQDGKIEQSEVLELAQARFQAADLNQDGMLSLEEAQQAALDRHAALDTNKDGEVTRREMRSSFMSSN